jgi:transposase
MSAHMPGDSSFQLLEVRAERLDASPATPRRRWSAEAKARLVEEALAPDANVSAIARRVGIAPSQLFGWRRLALRNGTVRPTGSGEPLGFTDLGTPPAGVVEICIGGVVIRAGADAGEDQLRRVIRAVRSA